MCRRNPPAPLATQTHEPKTKVVPLGSTGLGNLKRAIEFSSGSLMRPPTWCARCRVLSGCPPRGIPKVVGFGLGCAEIRNSKVQTTQDLDRFRPQYA
jgi:hypothetical protein